MTYRIFLSSVQKEFARERKAIADYIRKDMLLGTFFDVFLFEETAAQNRSAQGVYLREVRNSDIYLGLFGDEYGFEDSEGVSPTEREYDLATEQGKYRLAFVKRVATARVPKERAFVAKIEQSVTRRSFSSLATLKKAHNGIIATAMQWAGYVEKSGYGTEDIVRKCKEWGLREPEYHPSSVDFRLVLWRKDANESADFTQGGGVGEVGDTRGVESDGGKHTESIVSVNCNRLHPEGVEWVKSEGEVGGLLQDRVLLFVAESPRKSSEITAFLGMSRVYGNIARCLKALLDDKLIELTIPEKPKSRLQKYRLTRKGREIAKRLESLRASHLATLATADERTEP